MTFLSGDKSLTMAALIASSKLVKFILAIYFMSENRLPNIIYYNRTVKCKIEPTLEAGVSTINY